jgi:hypothetical protein
MKFFIGRQYDLASRAKGLASHREIAALGEVGLWGMLHRKSKVPFGTRSTKWPHQSLDDGQKYQPKTMIRHSHKEPIMGVLRTSSRVSGPQGAPSRLVAIEHPHPLALCGL